MKGCHHASTIRVAGDQITKTEAKFSRDRGCNPQKVEFDVEDKAHVCADRAFIVIKAHANEAVHSATEGKKTHHLDVVQHILKVMGTHDCSPSTAVALTARSPPKAAVEPEKDELTKTFKAARQYISNDCFMYSFSIARSIVILSIWMVSRDITRREEGGTLNS